MDLSKLSTDDLKALQAGDLSKVSTQGLQALHTQMPAAVATPASAPATTVPPEVGGANAVGTGFFRGLTRLAGLPVDTIANVIDLGKAGIGTAYGAVTGKHVPDELVPVDRSTVIGSGEWLLKKLRGTSAGKLMIDPVDPGYEGGYLQNGGSALTGVIRPSSLWEAANQALLSEGGAAASKAVQDHGGSPALAVAANLVPALAEQGAVAATKYAVRGADPKAMAQRVQDLKNAGVANPTLGLASGNGFIGGVENILQNTPGAVGVMRRNRDAAVAGMEKTTNEASSAASPVRGAFTAGKAIQDGIRSFADDVKVRQNALYDKLGDLIPAATPTAVTNTKNALDQLTTVDRAAPNISARFVNGKIQDIADAFNLDAGLVRPSGASVVRVPWASPPVQAPVNGEGAPRPMVQGQAGAVLHSIPVAPVVSGEGGWKQPKTPTLPYATVAKLRTQVGDEMSSGSLVPDVPGSQWKRLYAGLSEDMRGAADATGGSAPQAFDRANDFTRASIARKEQLQPFADKPAPEQAYTALAGTLGENGSIFQAVKKSLPPGARGTVAGTVIERLGKAAPGAQDENGAAWSPDRFLTNWNKMTPRARKELLSGFENADQVAADVNAVAKATSLMRSNSKMWANPSGTAANLGARAMLGGVGAGTAAAALHLASPLIPLGAAATMGGAYLGSRAVTSARVRNAMLRDTQIDPETLNALTASMAGTGQLQK